MELRIPSFIQRLKNPLKSASLGDAFSILIFAVSLVIVFLVLLQLPHGFGDWQIFYRAAQRPMRPFSVPGFFNAPWLAWLLAPFSFLPLHLGGAIWITVSIAGALWAIHRLKGGALAAVLSLLSPPFIRFITAGQVDVLPLVGFVAMLTADSLSASGLGIVLIVLKPQTFSAGVLTWWMGLEWKARWLVLMPFFAVLALSFVLHGFWPAEVQLHRVNYSIDASPWPYGIPIGLALLGYAIRRRKPVVGAFSTYFLTPYISPSSLFVYALLLFARAPRWLSVTTFVLLWTYVGLVS